MIVFYTKFEVVESLSSQKLIDFAFACVNGMRNVPENFKGHIWSGNESVEWKSGRNFMAYEFDSDDAVVAFRVAIVDENDELWTTDVVLNEKKHELQLRLAREKSIVSAEYNQNFRIPYMFRKIIHDKLGGQDFGLPVSDEPIFIDENNLHLIANLTNNSQIYSLPVIYVSHPFTGDGYELDINELAKDMAGSAHVLVEKNSETSATLKSLTDSRNAYNGAIDVFYNDDSFRYLRWPEITSNQFRYKISHAVYSRMAMRNIDDESSLSAIRLRNKIKKLNANNIEAQRLALKVEELEGKYNESQEFFDFAAEEIKNLEKKVNDLENDNFDLRNKVVALSDALNRRQGNETGAIVLEVSEKQYYEDEIKRIILECIKNSISTYGVDEQERRDFHILTDVAEHNLYSDAGNKIKNEMLRIIKKNKLNKVDISNLKELGFELQQGGHDKYVFHGDDRYIITVSNSPSDYRGGENLAHEAVNLIFGRT